MSEIQDQLKIVEITGTHAEQESDRYWRRFGAMLTINGALVVLVAAMLKSIPGILSFIVSLLGLFLSFAWYRINRLSKYYAARWYADMQEAINSSDILQNYIRARSETVSRIPRPDKRESSNWAQIVVVGIGIMWLLLMVYSIYGFLM